MEEIDINLEYEKGLSYVKAALKKYPNLTDEELLYAFYYLHDQGLFERRNVVNLCHAIEYVRVNEPGHSRDEIVRNLMHSNNYDRRDIEDVINRYVEQHGQIPTIQQFLEFHCGLKGIADLEAQLENKEREIIAKDRTVQSLEERLKCKLCNHNERSIVCIPCGHLYCCSRVHCRTELTKRGRCHLCDHVITNQIQTILA